MCDICKTEKGNCELLGNERVEFKVGIARLEDQLLTVYFDAKEDGDVIIDASYWIGDNIVADVTVPIKYCPFCGRKLHND